MISKEVSEINDLLRHQQRSSTSHTPDAWSTTIRSDGSSTVLHHDSGGESPGAEDRYLYGDLFPYPPAFAAENIPTQSSKERHVSECISNLPSPAQCDVLIKSYLSGYHTIAPLFHSPTFEEKVQQFLHLRYAKSR